MGWSPWRALREREHIDLVWKDLPRGVLGAWVPRGRRATIVLGVRLGRRSRRCVLAHELVHDERGIVTTALPHLLRAKEERAVDVEVARRLVPVDELRALVARAVDLGDGVGVLEVADAFDVDEPVARLALQLLAADRAA